MLIKKINLISDETYNLFCFDELEKFLNHIKSPPIKKKKGISYYNIPCSFDIETSSFYKSIRMEKKVKQAIMYEWTFAINNNVIYGRTWEEANQLYNRLIEHLNIDDNHRLIVFVHNLSYEFQFIRKRLIWSDIFSLEKRKPVKATTIEGIEFRCSYILSGYSLKALPKQIRKIKIEKKLGDLDYDLIRNSRTPLTDKEIEYCVYDVLVVIYYIREKIEEFNGITNLPLTKTGFVRNYTRNNCLYGSKTNDKYKQYRNLMKLLKLDSETYLQLKKAFAGGFTHASPYYSGDTIKNVHSFDLTSSYPTVMIAEKFPMSPPERVKINSITELDFNLDNYCCLFDMEIKNLKSKITYENYISQSHCRELKNALVNNGRLVSADSLIITVTEQDYFIIKKFYRWDECYISNFTRFRKDYLPKDLIMSILKLYKDKTELKDVEGKELEYLMSKEYINSEYGMCVTDICKNSINYNDNEWSETEVDITEAIANYNKSIRRFLYYAWGVWIPAYARMNLFTAIVECKEDYIYSDTDSVKIMNIKRHKKYFDRYNKYITNKLEETLKYYKIDKNLIKPKNKKGEEKPLGVWSYEGCYDKFKTIGAKRYIYTQDNDLHITIAGVNKIEAKKYLWKKYGEEVFEHFDDGLVIPSNHTGKLTHTYIDKEIEGVVTDYLGNTCEYRELSCIHMEKQEYELSLSEEYINYLFNIKTYEK